MILDKPSSGDKLLAALILLAAVHMFWGMLMYMTMCALCAALACKVAERIRRYWLDKTLERERQRLEADYQNRMYLAGEPVGTYGAYESVTMPITGYQNYDDGMHQWL